MVTEGEDWSRRVAGWIGDAVAADTPLLGICYGHQLLAQALGGEVGWNPRGREFGTVEVILHAEARVDPLFGHLPPRIPVHTCHAQSVLRLPPGAVCLASNAHDPHHAFVLGKTAWGVQFHPEFDVLAARAYIVECADLLRAEGIVPEQLLRSTRETSESEGLLERFGRMVRES
jgi:GMP synthase (glutamine-hydrolysing)